VEHRRSHEDRTCPVCRQGVLDDTWEQTAQAQIAELQQAAAAASQAKTRLDQAMRKASTFISPVPDGLLVGSHAGLGSIEPAVVAWASLGDAPDDPVLLADHLDQYVPQVAASMAPVHDEAQRELDRRQDLWRPVAAALAAWVTRARDGQSAADDVNRLKKAEDWLKAAAAAIRDDRFGPIAERSRQIWSQLRQQSNVDLGRVALAGASTQRRVELAVTIDGVEGAALGVMSQGELHALALSLFLPRATMPESPFRFVIVDDPVQAMDPARVDGLARVLSDVAKTRQVIVFTHDDRLPEAIRQLQLPGRVVEVTRRAGSVIELREGLTPAKRAIDDAMALAQSHRAGEVPLEVARRVIPGFCRVAVEAACADVVRRRRLRRGDDHASVESVLEASANLTRRLILAIWDQEDNRPNVSDEITARFGKSKAETYKLLNKGAHQGLEGDDFVGLVRNSEQFVGQLLELS
jgi:ABC-type lipoprotein export system ATPase subunit